MAIGPVKQVYLDRVKAAQEQSSAAKTTHEEGKQAAKQARRRRFRQQLAKEAPPSTIHKPAFTPTWAKRPLHPRDMRRATGGFGSSRLQPSPLGRTLSGGKGFQRDFDRKTGFRGTQLVGEGRTEPRQQKRMGLKRRGLDQFSTSMERFSKIGRATRRATARQMQFDPSTGGIVRGPTEAQNLQDKINAVRKNWARSITGEGVGDVRGPTRVGEQRDFIKETFGKMGKSGAEKEIEAYGQLSMRARQGYMPPRMGPVRIGRGSRLRERQQRDTYKSWEKWRVQQQNEMKKTFRSAGVPPTPGPGTHKRVTPRPPILDKSGRVSEESYNMPGANLSRYFATRGTELGGPGRTSEYQRPMASFTSTSPLERIGAKGFASRTSRQRRMSKVAGKASTRIRQSFSPTMSTQLFGG